MIEKPSGIRIPPEYTGDKPNTARTLLSLVKKYNIKTYVEVGVYYGYSARHLLTNHQLDSYFAIDNWSVENGGLKGCYVQEAMDYVYAVCKERLEKFPNAHIIKESSATAVSRFKDNSIDCVFIDACHEYNFIKQDIQIWRNKCTKLIVGHDYDLKPVKRAVDEEFSNAEIIYLGQVEIWYVVK